MDARGHLHIGTQDFTSSSVFHWLNRLCVYGDSWFCQYAERIRTPTAGLEASPDGRNPVRHGNVQHLERMIDVLRSQLWLIGV